MAALFSLNVYGISISSPNPRGQGENPEINTSNSCAKQKTAYKINPEPPDEIIAYYTEMLAWFTGVLAFFSLFQGYFLIRSDKTAKKAADAAKLSADAVVRVELPFLALIRADLIANGQIVAVGAPLPQSFEPNITFTNWGRSHAEITHGCIEWTVINKLPSRPEYKNIVAYAPGIVAVKDARILLDVPRQIILTPAQIVAVDTIQEGLWVFGFIRFSATPMTCVFV